MQPLDRLRLQLTIWYAGTFSLILLLLGIGLIVALSGQLSGDLDSRLESAVAAVRRAVTVRMAYGATANEAIASAVAEVSNPDRVLYLFGADGSPIIAPAPVDPRVGAAAARALNEAGSGDPVRDEFRTTIPQRWRLYAEQIAVSDSQAFAVVAVANAAGFRRQFERLLETFLAGALLALIAVGLGGYRIARVGAAPVERVMSQLRELTANAAHELRTPIAVLRGHAELALERERDAAAYTSALQQIAAESTRLGRLVDDLLILARAEAGTWPWRREALFLDDVADEVVESVTVLGAPRRIGVSLGRFEEARTVGDRDLVRQLLTILVENAVKFSNPGGSVRLDVFVDQSHPTVVVEDTGMGIAPEHLPHIFERFYRGYPDRSHAGAGLGLAIAKWIVEQHEARIEVQSALGRGTRISVRFPGPGLPPRPPL
jgi:signal transduction histidine kinase